MKLVIYDIFIPIQSFFHIVFDDIGQSDQMNQEIVARVHAVGVVDELEDGIDRSGFGVHDRTIGAQRLRAAPTVAIGPGAWRVALTIPNDRLPDT
jgi:hypothetical protein